VCWDAVSVVQRDGYLMAKNATATVIMIRTTSLRLDIGVAMAAMTMTELLGGCLL
jgi:hypothetical protein